MALLIYSRSPYEWTLGEHRIRHPMRTFAFLVFRHGLKGFWALFSVIIGVGVVGVVGWIKSRPLTGVLLAVAVCVFLVLAIGSYRTWLAAARFVPDLGFDARRRADTLNAWRRSRGGTDQDTLMNYQASMVQDALIDFDRFQQAGLLDSRASRELIEHPQTMTDLDDVIALFRDAANRANAQG
jgi:hypothetical protein